MGKSKPPTPPSPTETAGAQTAQNIGTAITQGTLNNINQVTPDGSLTYETTGYDEYTDPNTGRVYQIPKTTATQTLSEAQQAIKDQGDQTSLGLATLANNQTAALSDHLAKPVDFSQENVDRYTNDRFSDDFDRQWDRNQERLSTQLSNSGIKMGSEAYKRAMDEYGMTRSGAHDNHLGNMFGQSMSAITAERNQPINEISALTSGSQVSSPQFAATNPAQLANTDVAGLINSNYNQRLSAWQANQQQRGGALGGLFGLGASAISGGFI